MKDVVHTAHRLHKAVAIPHVADIKLHLVVRQRDAHVLLFLLVATEDAHGVDPRRQEATQHGVTKGARAAGNHDGGVIEQERDPLRLDGERADRR